MTERLYYTDSYLRSFTAQIVDLAGNGQTAYLDRTAFYPTSGGQPFDTGSIGGVAVIDVADEGERIAHHLSSPIEPGAAACEVDWTRRFDHMQQHTGQHLLSAVLEESFGLKTMSFHLGAASASIDVEGGSLTPDTVQEAEWRANQAVFENRPVTASFEDAAAARGLRKPSDREGTLRIISIEGLDRSACGGTHVRSTGEIGPVLVRKIEKIRNQARIEFVCGGRAVRRARADFEALSRAAQLFSSPLEAVPSLIEERLEAARAAEKGTRKLELSLASYQGAELYRETVPAADGFRRVQRRMTSGNLEQLRALATSFTAHPKAVFLAALEDPPSALLAVSEDAGIDAGKILKTALAEAGGRGGGTARMAQGSVPDSSKLDGLLGALESSTGIRA
jgi:alanyl-tRNA synthetase